VEKYTDIVEVIAPDKAIVGDTVQVIVRVKNLYTEAIYIAVTGRYNETNLSFSPPNAAVSAGQTYDFTTFFTMPQKDIRVHLWSWYWAREWYQDDYTYKDIIAEAVPVFKELKIEDYVTV